MKHLVSIWIILLPVLAGAQQYYFRGDVRDDGGRPLQNVNILLQSTGYVYRSGSDGSFGIMGKQPTDSLVLSLDGYEKLTVGVKAATFAQVRLKILSANASTLRRDRLVSVTRNLTRETQREWFAGDETYASLIENRFVSAARYPSTSLALNIDRASYSNIRRFIHMSTLVPPDAVRIEEMLNYFNNNYREPAGREAFDVHSVITRCAWNPLNQLLFINLSSRKVNLDSLPPANLVFLVDVSGSMDMPNRLPLLKSAFRLLVNNLRARDTVSIVVYGGVVGTMLNPTSGAEKQKIMQAIDSLTPGGSTPGESGIRMAYRLAASHYIKGGNNRVILATDGDFNVGLKKDEELEDLIAQRRHSGIYLTCLGVGMGNYKDSKIQTLARKGNGNYAYLDSYQEAEKVLLQEFTQTMYAVADNVYMTISFNPAYVREYRLIGFDNKMGALRDTLSVMEGGEVGSGQSMIAAFEITPSDVIRNLPDSESLPGSYATISLQYNPPQSDSVCQKSYNCPYELTPFERLDSSYRFSTAVIMFGSILRQSPYARAMNWTDLINLAGRSMRPDDPSQREFVDLVQEAKSLYQHYRKKRRRSGWE
ncbi:MAG TPA: von Willebrand factor type A domain-containing protein [Chitinophagaceae bacterium]|nr:von Willebrand factor type A domain-containing protein [Chitinophagaceae bacterium]